MEVNELKVSFHIPTLNEITLAISFVNKELNKTMKFLSESILNIRKQSSNSSKSSSSKSNAKYSKEENYRELNYLYFLAYGSSRLLKRPYKERQSLTSHINSNVSIGYEDTIDKGLGFELANLVNEDCQNDQSNIYNSLSDENREIVQNLRLNLIEFVLKLASKN